MGFILSWTSLPWQVRRFFPSMWLKLVSLWWQPELLLWRWRWEGWKNCEFQFSAIIKQNISDRTHRRNTVFFVPFLMIGYSINFIYYPPPISKKKLLLQVNLTEVAFYLSIIFISFQNHFIKIQKLFCYIISLTFNIQWVKCIIIFIYISRLCFKFFLNESRLFNM